MKCKAWACALAAVVCASASWAQDDEPGEERVIIIDRVELEELRRESQATGREVAEAVREALREAREEMRRDTEGLNRDRREQFHFHLEDDELRDAIRDAWRDSSEALQDAGTAMRELMAQGLPALGAIGPLMGAEPFFSQSSAGNARSVDERRDAAGVREIRIENVSGRVVVEGSDLDEIHVTGSIGEDVEELVFTVAGDTAEVVVKVPKGRRNLKIRSELTIRVPKRLRVEAQTVSGGVEARNIEGDLLDLETVSGGIRVEGCTGDIEASTTSGGIEIADARGTVRAECVSGGIHVSGTPVSINAESVSGTIKLQGAQREVESDSVSGRVFVSAGALERLRVESVSGGCEYEGGIAPNGRFDISSISGGVRLTFDSDVAAEFNLESFSGGIEIDLTGAPTSAKRQVSFTTGDGGARIDVEAFSGGIRVGRR